MEMSLNEENPYNEIIEIKELTDFQQILFILMLILLFQKIILEF